MNTDKVIGNFLVAFGTAGAAAFAIGSPDVLLIALANAIILGIIAAGKELCEEGDSIPKKIRPTLCKLTHSAVLL